MEAEYALDLLARRAKGPRLTLDLGDGPVTLDLLAPRRREARAVELLAKHAERGGVEYIDALYVAASVLLSHNAQRVAVDCDTLADCLSVNECAKVVELCSRAQAAEAERLGKA